MKALDILASSRGKIVSLGFTKKNGEFRKMLCRVGVHKGVKGTGNGSAPPMPMFRVFDMKKNAWRMVNGDTIEYIKANGKSYNFPRSV
jgi:hypothetical protein